MSFSSEVKEELSKINNLANKDCVKLELSGYSVSSNFSRKGKNIRFSTESQYNINRFAKLLNNINVQDYKIELQGKNYVITSNNTNIEESIMQSNFYELKEDLHKRAFIRGCFLGSGSINNPENLYHIEIIFKEKSVSDLVLKILKEYEINFKLLENKVNYIIYSKDGEEISKLLALIGANNSVLKFEDIRVYRDMRNNVNRIVNCETANLSKTINASMKQIKAINKIKEKGKFSSLSENLREIATLRLKYPDASLVELGKMANPQVGKSGVNHRMKAIEQIANELK